MHFARYPACPLVNHSTMPWQAWALEADPGYEAAIGCPAVSSNICVVGLPNQCSRSSLPCGAKAILHRPFKSESRCRIWAGANGLL